MHSEHEWSASYSRPQIEDESLDRCQCVEISNELKHDEDIDYRMIHNTKLCIYCPCSIGDDINGFYDPKYTNRLDLTRGWSNEDRPYPSLIKECNRTCSCAKFPNRCVNRVVQNHRLRKHIQLAVKKYPTKGMYAKLTLQFTIIF